MLRKLLTCALVLVIALSLTTISIAAPYFRGTGLMNIPTAYVEQQGLFTVGLHTAVLDQKRDELAIRADFGLFNITELGLILLKKQDKDFLMGNVKLLVSRESGSAPSLSIGIDNFGEEVEDDSGGYERSIYGVLSKQFNLPVIHLIGGHLGVGNHRYEAETSIGKYLHGVFVGVSKDLYLSFLNSQVSLMFEVDGRDLNVGLRYTMDTGLSIGLAAGELSSEPEEIKYYLGVRFTNASMMKKLDQSSELAKRAVKIANEARSGSHE